MTNDNQINNYPPYFKIIKKSEVIEKKDFLTFFAIDKITMSIVCEFNHKYPLNTRKVIGPIDIDNWTKFIEKTVKKKLKDPPVIIDDEDSQLIQGNLDQEYDNIVNIVLEIKNSRKKNKYNVSQSDLSDQSDKNNNSQDEKNKNSQQQLVITAQIQNNIPVLGVLQAIRRLDEGLVKVIGRIVSRSINIRVLVRSEWICQNPECRNSGILNFYPPKRHVPEFLDTTTGTNPSCRVCRTFGSLDVTNEYQNAKKIQLDDIDTLEEKFDRLNVIMYGDASDKIIDGEVVEIEGNLITQKITPRNNSSNGSIMVNVLHSDKPIIYKNRKEIKLTQKDIDDFYRWKKICITAYKKEIELVKKCKRCAQTITPLTFEQRVVKLFAPNVHGHSDAKMGILRSIVSGSKKEKGTDNGRRGRIHTNLIGDPGTTKTVLSTESTKLDQNSRMVDAAGASGKSLVGIVDKENDGLMVKYGVVVAAKNSHVVINEASELSHDDQSHLIGIAEEGKTTLDKWGEHITIDAPATLIFTTNPLGTKWESSKISEDKMVVIRKNLLSRIDQTYGFFDTQTEEEMEGFIEELEKIANRKLHNYNFLTKYLQYVKTIEPEFVGTTKYRLNRFWINAKLKGVATNRSFFSIKRIAEAQAKLNLSWVIDDYIVKKTMESLQLIYNQYGKLIEQIQNPRDLTAEVFYNILKENKGTNYSIRELCRIASERNKQVNAYLKNKWDLENNRELKNIIDIVEQKENVKIVGIRPKLLTYYFLSDQSDQSDKSQSELNEKNNKKFDNDQSTVLSDRSDRSDSTDKLVSISDTSQPIEMTNEQYDSWFGNEQKEDEIN
jgi:DNA replicative helicase MCM subunit Mcm2 (Cdc46/Mcm family)